MILFFVKNDIPDKLDMNVIEQANEHEIPILVIHPMSNKRIDGQYKSQVISRYESSESVANFAGACELDKTLFEKVKLEYHAKAIKDYANELVSLRKINSAKYVPIQQFVISTRTLRGDFEYAMYELDEPQLRQHILRICETKCPEVQVESDKITKILNDALIWIFAKFDPWALRVLAAFICIAIAFVLHKMNYTFNWQQWLPLAFIMYFIYFMYSLNY